MEIRTKKAVKKMKVEELQFMTPYLIYDEKNGESNILIVDTHHHGTIITNCSNERSIHIGGINKTGEVNVIGKINNFDVINVDLYDY